MNALVIAWLIAAVCFVGALAEQPILRWWQRRQQRQRRRQRPPESEFLTSARRFADAMEELQRAFTRRDDDGCIARAVLFGLAAEGLVALLLWAVLR